MSASISEPIPQPAPRRKRLDALDVLRAVAAVAVILIHTSAAVLLTTAPQTRAFHLAGFINQFSRFAVPAFVLLAGAGLFYNYGHRNEFSWSQYYLRRLQSIGVPYVFWSVLYFTYYSWIERNFSHFLPRLLDALGSANAVYTLYFFVIITPFYVLFPFMRRLARSRWMDVVALLAILGNGYLVWFSFPHPKVPLGATLSQLYAYAGNMPFWWMGPFFLGAWLVYRWDAVAIWVRRLWIPLAAVAAGLLVWVMREFYTYVGMNKLAYVATNLRPSAYWYGLVIMVALVGLGFLVAQREGFVKNMMMSLGKYSLAVFLVHPLVMHVVGKVLQRVPLGPVMFFAAESLLVLGGSYVVARLIEKIPGGGWVIGIR